ncbi:hypothetical protein [Natranaerobius thermophilus]|uniref:Uncharacterized protein n=2 Tax=Natranaerobius TaxID=375928 RepID=B2A6U6_NATTJ|nr:hypothetical protein Nther_0632 [Natranaerobius thermophilus JW/NM-WN-LF]
MLNVLLLSITVFVTGLILSSMWVPTPLTMLLVGLGLLGTTRSGALLLKDKFVGEIYVDEIYKDDKQVCYKCAREICRGLAD